MKRGEDSDRILEEVKEGLMRAVGHQAPPSILFSGGLDSSILAALLSKFHENVSAVTVLLEPGGDDLGYATLVAETLKLNHICLTVSVAEALAVIPEVIGCLGSFDPALPNDLVVYFGLKALKDSGALSAVTGDGADELLAGYDFMQHMSDADEYIRAIAPRLAFGSNLIGESLGLGIVQPYLDRRFMDMVLDVPASLKIVETNGRMIGKWILREAFSGLLPSEVLWQEKRPLETGSGMSRLREVLSSMVDEQNFSAGFQGIEFMSREHFYYYTVYRDVVGEIPPPGEDEIACRNCGAGMPVHAFHCRVCGYVFDWRRAGAIL